MNLVKQSKSAAALAAFACVAVLSLSPANAQPAKADRVVIDYMVPKNSAHKPLYESLERNRVLEDVQAKLSLIRWPRPLRLEFNDCDGEPNAFYADAVVRLCYEFVDKMWKSANSSKRPAAITREDAFTGQLLQVLIHETSHALFDMLKIPVLGQEEAAADQLAAYYLLQFPSEAKRRLILGAVFSHADELKVYRTRDLYRPRLRLARVASFSGEHGTTAQRLFNLLCLAYGSDHVLFGDAISKGFLPQERADICDLEYRQVDLAYRQLIEPHIESSR